MSFCFSFCLAPRCRNIRDDLSSSNSIWISCSMLCCKNSLDSVGVEVSVIMSIGWSSSNTPTISQLFLFAISYKSWSFISHTASVKQTPASLHLRGVKTPANLHLRGVKTPAGNCVRHEIFFLKLALFITDAAMILSNIYLHESWWRWDSGY